MNRIKSVEFASQTDIITRITGTDKILSGTTQIIYIPETGITFKSVTLFVDCVNDITNTSAQNLTNPTKYN